MDRERLAVLDQIIEEGNQVEGLLASEGWAVVRRTLKALVENYRTDCYDAAKDTTKNLANFLGRMEGLELFLVMVEQRFSEAKKGALTERITMEQLDKENKSLDGEVADAIGSPMLQTPGTI